jgi:hypothetical protein
VKYQRRTHLRASGNQIRHVGNPLKPITSALPTRAMHPLHRSKITICFSHVRTAKNVAAI